MKTPLFKRITRTLATASQLIIVAPVRLPPKVVAIAKYVSLGMALLEAVVLKEEGAVEHELPAYHGQETRANLDLKSVREEVADDGQ